MAFPSNTPDNKNSRPFVLLDGGSQVNVVTNEYAVKLKQLHRKEFQPLQWKGKVKPVGSPPIDHLGAIGIPFTTLDKTEHIIPFIILEDLGEYDMIFGLNILEKLDIQISYSTGEVLIEGRAQKLLPNHYKQSHSVRNLADIQLEPRTIQYIPITLDHPVTKEQGYQIVPSSILMQTCLRTPSGITKNDFTQIQITNKILQPCPI